MSEELLNKAGMTQADRAISVGHEVWHAGHRPGYAYNKVVKAAYYMDEVAAYQWMLDTIDRHGIPPFSREFRMFVEEAKKKYTERAAACRKQWPCQ